jgi:threonine/homoserine/homoserine lactone efflux protein
VTIAAPDLGLYALGILLLWATPGPVWVAITARALAGGFRGAWPLAVGVTLGDLLWPLCAILGVTWILSVWGGFLEALAWVAAATFVLMGALVIRGAGRPIGTDSRLTRPGMGRASWPAWRRSSPTPRRSSSTWGCCPASST